MKLYEIDPLEDPRWPELLERHPRASLFHTRGWLGALQRSYGFEPMVLTSSPPDAKLENGAAFCWINSWLTGRRLVSLPFSDHCEPLFNSPEEFERLISHLQTTRRHRGWNYVEVRPINDAYGRKSGDAGFQPCQAFLLHRLDLRPNLEELFGVLDKASVQRRIRRAERARLTEKVGRSETLLKDFYRLLIQTRKRHHLPPQPYDWFRNLTNCLGEALDLRVGYRDEIPIAAILTLRFKRTVYYKYGCSDARFHRFGGMPFLLWKAVEGAKSEGAQQFDLGRSAEDDDGLVRFKSNWVPLPTRLVYWRYPAPFLRGSGERWALGLIKLACACAPDKLLTAVGKLVYRHIG